MFTTIFAAINDVATLKSLANTIVAEINNAYQVRAKELMASKTKGTEPKAEIKTDEATTKPTPSSKSVAEKAKEIASKAKKEKSQPKTANKVSNTGSEELVQIAITDKEAIKKLNLIFEPYREKSWVLHGDTKQIKDALSEIKGIVFNGGLTFGEKRFAGWVCKKENAQNVADTLGLNVKVS